MKNNEKHFSSFLKGFQLPKIVSGLRRFFKLFKRLQYILESFCAVFGMADISKYSNIWWSTHLYVSCFHQTSPILDGTPTSIFHFFCLSVYLSIFLSVYPSTHPPLYVTFSVHPICPPACLFIQLSIHHIIIICDTQLYNDGISGYYFHFFS